MRKSYNIFDHFLFIYEKNQLFYLKKSHHLFEIYIYGLHVIVISLRLSFSVFLKKSCLYTFLMSTFANYMINDITYHMTSHVTFSFSTYVDLLPPYRLTNSWLVDLLLQFQKLSPNNSASLFIKQGSFSCFVFILYFVSAPFIVTISLVWRRRPAIRCPVLCPTPIPQTLVLGLAPPSATLVSLNYDPFQGFMRTFIKIVKASVAPVALGKAKDNGYRLLKPQNLDLFYGHSLQIKCYYFCQ